MQILIKAGKHRPNGYNVPRLTFGKTSIHYAVVFTESCRYNLRDDQTDTNKLFGIGYFNTKKFPFHHYNSARFGWYYNNNLGKIVIVMYCYVKGERVFKPIMSVDIDSYVQLSLQVTKSGFTFTVRYINHTATEFVACNTDFIGYTLSDYFGGKSKIHIGRDNPAPHDIVYYKEKYKFVFVN